MLFYLSYIQIKSIEIAWPFIIIIFTASVCCFPFILVIWKYFGLDCLIFKKQKSPSTTSLARILYWRWIDHFPVNVVRSQNPLSDAIRPQKWSRSGVPSPAALLLMQITLAIRFVLAAVVKLLSRRRRHDHSSSWLCWWNSVTFHTYGWNYICIYTTEPTEFRFNPTRRPCVVVTVLTGPGVRVAVLLSGYWDSDGWYRENDA